MKRRQPEPAPPAPPAAIGLGVPVIITSGPWKGEHGHVAGNDGPVYVGVMTGVGIVLIRPDELAAFQ